MVIVCRTILTAVIASVCLTVACSDNSNTPLGSAIPLELNGTGNPYQFVGTWKGEFRVIANFGTDSAYDYKSLDVTLSLRPDGRYERQTPGFWIYEYGYGGWDANADRLFLQFWYIYQMIWDPIYFADGPYQIEERYGDRMVLRRIMTNRVYQMEIRRISHTAIPLSRTFGRPPYEPRRRHPHAIDLRQFIDHWPIW